MAAHDEGVHDPEHHPLRSSGGGASVEEGPVDPKRRRRLFAACSCILGNETAERLTYYGIQTNMSLYAKQFLGYPAAQATSMLQAWKATVYLTPLLGAFLADAYMGRFMVILVFSSIYLLGLSGTTAVNIAPALKPRFNAPPASGDYAATRNMFWAFMYLIALGSGGIKACVSSFGGDQFREDSPREKRWRSSFFNWFYFAVNVGSLVATLVVVPIQESKGYGIGFGIPTVFMAAAILVLLIGAAARLYTYIPPEGSPLYRIWHVLLGAARNRKLPLPPTADELFEPAPGEGGLKFRMAHTPRMRCLDKAAVQHGVPGRYQVSLTEVEETKALLGLAPIFLCVCIWQMSYDPISTLLPLPGDAMERSMGRFKIPASSISFANTFGVMISVAAYDLIVVPITNKIGRPITITARIGYGYIVAILALLSAGFIELGRYRVISSSGLLARWEAAVAANPKADYNAPEFTQPMSIWWQVIPYFLQGASETLTNVGVMEMFYSEVSEGTRALGSSLYLLTVAIGTYLAGALNMAIAGATAGSPWVADNPMFGHYDLYFFLNAGILAVGYLLFLGVAATYKGAASQDETKVGKGAVELTGPTRSGGSSGGGGGRQEGVGAAWHHGASELRMRWGPGGSPKRSPLAQMQSQPLDPL